MKSYMNESGGSYGRSAGPRAFFTAQRIERLRDCMGSLLGTTKIENIVFTSGATMSLNLVLQGFKWTKGAVLHSPLEHNSVMRPLVELHKRANLRLECMPALKDGTIDLKALSRMEMGNFDLVVINHQSNVNGVIQPLEQIRGVIGSTPILVDTSQSLGTIVVKADEWGLDFVAFTGHKGLLGPPGTGGLFIREPDLVSPLLYGGTGSSSHSYDMPQTMPDRFDAGTPNLVGLFGLLAAIENSPDYGYEQKDIERLLSGLRELSGLWVFAAENIKNQGSVISVSSDKLEPGSFGDRLYHDHQIETRIGLHCSPLAHRHLGTFPTGTVRLSFSPYHDARDLDYLLEAIRKVTQ